MEPQQPEFEAQPEPIVLDELEVVVDTEVKFSVKEPVAENAPELEVATEADTAFIKHEDSGEESIETDGEDSMQNNSSDSKSDIQGDAKAQDH